MEPVVDEIVDAYGPFYESPASKFFLNSAMFFLLSDVGNRSVLTLGCGEGYYSRLIKSWGASSVTGVDDSPQMIETAKRHERKRPLGIEYITSDVTTVDLGRKFEYVIMVFVLVSPRDKEHLLKMCQVAYAHTEFEGVLVTIALISQPPRDTYFFPELGIEIVNSGMINGEQLASFRLRSILDPEVVLMSTEVTLFTAATYVSCLEEVGYIQPDAGPISVMLNPIGLDDVTLLKNIRDSNVFQSVMCMRLI